MADGDGLLSPEELEGFAHWFLGKRENGESVSDAEQLPDLRGIADVYAIHNHMTKIKSSLGAHQGWKCGACAPDSQAAFGLAEPFRAPLFAKTVKKSGATFDIDNDGVLLVEAEFAFMIGKELPPKAEGAEYSEDEVWDAVEAVATAIEIVGTRWSGDAKEKANGMQKLSDCGLNISCVTGAVYAKADISRALDAVKVDIAVNGTTLVTGSGANVLGNPLTSLTWLTNSLIRDNISTGRSEYGGESLPAGLRKGDFVMSGATAVLSPENFSAGDTITATFEGFGSVECEFASSSASAL